ncbi:MAG: AzlD domain-containing protein [Actinomycetota bacterium]|nr:AzlD domain-containing protein [Actinomycetota bacterium]
MPELLILLIIGLGTYALRAAFLVTARAQPPAPLARWLPHVGPAVLAAITLPALLAPRGSITLVDTVPALLGASVAAVLWRRTRSLPLALFAALAVSVLAQSALAHWVPR